MIIINRGNLDVVSAHLVASMMDQRTWAYKLMIPFGRATCIGTDLGYPVLGDNALGYPVHNDSVLGYPVQYPANPKS
jgi:hypothetical protein